MVHQSLELQKQGVYLMVSLVSVFQVAAAQRFSGAVLNLDQRTLDSSQPSAVDWDGAQKVISYFQPLHKIQPELTLKYVKAMNDAVKGWAN
jgi:predicted SnoaL-like aldol condensation-catalyzing enzyme